MKKKKTKTIVLEYDFLYNMYGIKVDDWMVKATQDRDEAYAYFNMLVEYKGESKTILKEVKI